MKGKQPQYQMEQHLFCTVETNNPKLNKMKDAVWTIVSKTQEELDQAHESSHHTETQIHPKQKGSYFGAKDH